MSLIYADRVKETSTTTGTGTYSLAGAEAGHQGVVAAIGDGNTAYFCAEDGTDWEVFEGTVTDGSPDTLSRDTILASSNAGSAVDWAAGTKNIFLVVPAEKVTDLDTRLKVISSDLTLYVATTGNDTTGDGSSGSPWATPQKALDYLNGYWISPDATVTTQCADGTYTFTEATSCTHPCAANIVITGENTHSKSMTSVQSSSGSAGAWSVVINLDGVANIAEDDYVIIHTASGGTRPTFVLGCHKVTNVDSGNNRITFASTHQHASAPSGSVEATVLVMKTIFVGDGCHVLGKASGLILDKMVMVGDASNYCFSLAEDLLRLGVVGFVGGSGATYAANLTNAVLCEVNTSTIPVFSGGNTCIRLQLMSKLRFSTFICSGAAVGHGLNSFFSDVFVSKLFVTGNKASGVRAETLSRLRLSTATSTGNTGGTGAAVYATNSSHVVIGSITEADNASTYSPAVNTSGNEESYINT